MQGKLIQYDEIKVNLYTQADPDNRIRNVNYKYSTVEMRCTFSYPRSCVVQMHSSYHHCKNGIKKFN